MISGSKALVSEPKVLITGVEGAGKTLFAVQQADLLTREGGGELYQVNIRGADPHHLPKLPFEVQDLAYNADGSPMLDPQTGEHLPKWATLPPGSVIIVDEAHKVFPQRGPGRPPRHIEMLAEGRQAGIRFVLLSQAPGSIDGFLRDRIHRHYHLERKGNMERATVFEFDHCVIFPRTAWQERKDAQVHFWSYPKQYYGWWESAKTHGFKMRIPWKIWAAIAFVPVVGYVIYSVVTSVGGVMDGVGGAVGAPAASAPSRERSEPVRATNGSKESKRQVFTNADDYLKHYRPVVPLYPWSAPAYQDQDVTAKPDLYCMSSGVDGADACNCYSEQMTPIDVPSQQCRHIARHGIYNPHRASLQDRANQREAMRDKPEKARSGPSGVPAMALIPSKNAVDAPTNSTPVATPQVPSRSAEVSDESVGG